MKIFVTYDVAISTDGGKRRLARVAKVCRNYGLRVQNSVFECEMGWETFVAMKAALLKIIDMERDSLRIYNLGNRWNGKAEHYGTKRIPDVANDALLF